MIKRYSEDTSNIVRYVVSARRVSKVVKGGRRFSSSVLIVVGDEAGQVGFALEKRSTKHMEITDKAKAVKIAKNNMIRVNLREGRTLHHDIHGKYCATRVILRSASPGRGVIAGGAMRPVFSALGIKDVVAKIIGSSNPYNVVRAAFDAFSKLAHPKYIASKRYKKISEIVVRR